MSDKKGIFTPTFKDLATLRAWITTIPEPYTKVEDIGVGSWERHGERGFDRRLVTVLDDTTTGPFTCKYQIPNHFKLPIGEIYLSFQSFLDEILTIFDEEGTSRAGSFWAALQPTITLRFYPGRLIPEILEITSVWVEDD